MKARCYVQIGTLLAVLLVSGQSGIAALWEDPNAMKDGWSHWVDFGDFPVPAYGSGGALNGHIDYAVYEPYQCDAYITDLYVYAYQVFNDDSTVGIDFFSVGLSADVQVSEAMYALQKTWAEPGGSIPNMSLVLPEGVLFVFQFDNIGANEHSRTLLFTSDCAPDMGKGIVFGGASGGAIVDLPSPVPEPATFGLLSAGALLAFRRRQSVSKV